MTTDQTKRLSLELFRDAYTIQLILVLGLAVALRSYMLGTESYWIDEMSTVIEGQQGLQELFSSGRLDQPPAYYVPFHFWIQAMGANEVSTRAFSVLFSTSSIVLVFLIGKNLFGKEVGMYSAFIMTISEFQIYYAQETRYYTFFEFTALLSFMLFIPALTTSKRIYLFLYGMASIVMICSHAFGLFALAAQGLFFILKWEKYRNILIEWVICQAFILIAIIPYFYPMIFGVIGLKGAVNQNIGSTVLPSILDPIRSMYRFILPTRLDQSWKIILVNYAEAGLFLVAGTWVYAFRVGYLKWVNNVKGIFEQLLSTSEIGTRLLLIVFWLIVPILLPVIASWLIAPLYQDRYLIDTAPALYLMLALGIYNIRKSVPVIVSLATLVIMVIPGLQQYYSLNLHEPWRNVAEFVKENATENDVIVFAPNMGIGIQERTFNWYYQGSLQECGLSYQTLDPNMISVNLRQCIAGHHRYWAIISGSSESISFYESFFLGSENMNSTLIKKEVFSGYPGISVCLFKSEKQ